MATSSKKTTSKKTAKATVPSNSNFDKALWANAFFFLLIFAVFATVYYSSFKSQLDLNGDNASYYLLGKSISKGEGYTLYNDLNAKSQNHYPPGYPIIIAFLMIFSKSTTFLKIANGFFFLGSLFLSFQVFRKFEVKWPVALVSVLFMIFNYHLVKSSTIIMSEIPYLLFGMLTLWFLMKIDFAKAFWKDNNFYYFLFSLSFAFHIRTAGIALLAGVLFYLLFEKKWKGIAAVFGGFVVLALPWILRGKILGLQSSYQKQLFQINPYQPELGQAGLMDIASRFGENFMRYVSKEIPIGLLTFREVNYKIAAVPMEYVAGLVLIIAMIAGMYLLPKYRSLLVGYFAGTFFILMLWPKQWFGARFILPLIPIMIFLLVNTASVLLEKLFSLVNIKSIYLPFLLLPLIAVNMQAYKANKDAKYQSYPLSRLFIEAKVDYPPNWKNYIKTAEYAKNNFQPGDIIACRKPQMFHIFSDRFTTLYPYLEDDKALIDVLDKKKVKYVVVDPLGYSSTGKYLVPAINNNKQRFRQILHLQNPDTYLMELLPPR